MDRRSVLRYIGVASAAALVLPSCVTDKKKLSVALNNLQIKAEDESLLADIASTLIPSTDTPGAREVEAHLFAIVMADDCMSPENQRRFVSGLRAFDAETKKITGESFLRAKEEDRAGILKMFEEKRENVSEDVSHFYGAARHYIIQGYTSSQFFLTKVKPYVHIPGPVFIGCKQIQTDTNAVS